MDDTITRFTTYSINHATNTEIINTIETIRSSVATSDTIFTDIKEITTIITRPYRIAIACDIIPAQSPISIDFPIIDVDIPLEIFNKYNAMPIRQLFYRLYELEYKNNGNGDGDSGNGDSVRRNRDDNDSAIYYADMCKILKVKTE